jgi:predicted transcriptional regulator
MSIQPRWAQRIQAGEKTVELRRRRSGCEPGTPVVIYTSHPVKRITATATVARVHAAAPGELADRVAAAACVTAGELLDYLGDLPLGYGIELTDVRVLDEPVALDRPGPQSWRYLFADEPEGAAVLAATGLAA